MQKQLLSITVIILFILTILTPISAATGDEVTKAIVTPSTLPLVNSNTTSGGDDQFVVNNTPAQGFPTNGNSYANINTGDNSEDAADFTLNLTIPEGAQTLSFDWMFASNEYPTQGPQYNDSARVEIISGSSSQNILFLPGNIPVSVANAWSIFSAPTDNIGYSGVTPMYTTNFDISSFAGSTILLSFFIEDVPDTLVTSALFIDNLHIGPISDLSITKTVNNARPSVGSTLKYLLTVNNNGPDTATQVQVAELLSSKLKFVSATPSKGTYNPVTGIWTIGTLLNGESATLTINAIVKSAGTIINNIYVETAAYDPNLSNNQATETIQATGTVNAETVGMQETGIPVAMLLLAIMAVLGGFIESKRK